MKMLPGPEWRLRPLIAALTLSVSAWGLAGGGSSQNAELKQKNYRQEQVAIELALAKIQLQSLRDKQGAFETQARIDEWLRINDARLKAQATLARDLDRLAPLPPTGTAAPVWFPGAPLLKGTPEEARFSELDALEGQAMSRLQARASGVELQGLIDEWANSLDGEAILREKRELLDRAACRPSGHHSGVGLGLESLPELPAGASAARVAQHRAETRRINLLREIRASAPPEATPFEVQALIDARRSELEALTQEAAALQPQIAREALDAQISALQQEANAAVPGLSGSGILKKP